jgi:hypothetical protein
MALSKIDIANMVTGATPVANGGTGQTTFAAAGLDKRPNVKSIWINGDMAVSQRATSVTGKTAGGYYTVDRMQLDISGTIGTWTVAQESLTSGSAYTAGFANAYRIDCTSATASPADAAFLKVISSFEGQDLQLFKKGTANAEKWTLSFWVKSNKTGTAQVNLRDMDNTRMIGASYSISSADTWEHKVCNFAADTTGALDDDNARSLIVEWWLDGGGNNTSGAMPTAWEARAVADSMAAGSLDLAGSTDNDWAITGIQLEVGEFSSTTLPPFQHESFGDNLARCYRYYQMPVHNKDHQGNNEEYGAFNTGTYSADAYFRAARPLGVEMRANPTLKSSSGTNYFFILSGVNDDINDLTLHNDSNFKTVWVYNNDEASSTAGQAGILMANNLSAYIAFDAEL